MRLSRCAGETVCLLRFRGGVRVSAFPADAHRITQKSRAVIKPVVELLKLLRFSYSWGNRSLEPKERFPQAPSEKSCRKINTFAVRTN